MLNKIIVSFKAQILVLLILMIFIAKSTFLILFLTTLILILLILDDKNVNKYLKKIVKSLFLLLFIFLIYIIISRSICGALLFTYKILLIILLVKNFMLNINFNGLDTAINALVFPLKYFKVNRDKISFNIALYTYFLVYLKNAGTKINKNQLYKNQYNYSIKYFWIPKMFYALDQTAILEKNLKLKHYNVKKDKINMISVIILMIFYLLFIFALFKEVIL